MAAMAPLRISVEIEGSCCCADQPARPLAVPHYGAPRSTTAEERAVRGPGAHHYEHRKAGSIMDILADKEIPLAVGYTDEAGNPTAAPADATETWTSDNEASVVIVTADDGVLVARATGAIDQGPANIHLEASWTGEDGGTITVTADDVLVPVAGLAERATVSFGTAREITPDA